MRVLRGKVVSRWCEVMELGLEQARLALAFAGLWTTPSHLQLPLADTTCKK